MSEQVLQKPPADGVPCRFCGQAARFVDRYRSPFKEDRAIFNEQMGVYFCEEKGIGFADPVPTKEALHRYYNELYRDRRRPASEDPHRQYTVIKSTPLAESQFMYLSEHIDFDKIQTVIDMGCGHGLLLRRIHAYNPEIRLIGIELDPEVGPFLKEFGAEFIHASAGESVTEICKNIGANTLLISSHALHYQPDFVFLQDIIRETKKTGRNSVFIFIEVPNEELLNDPAYVHNRVYDVPKLIFFTLAGFSNGLFDLNIINVATNGWTIDQELVFRARRLARYQSGKGRSGLGRVLQFGKSLVPIRARMAIKAALFSDNADQSLPYFSYGGNRRAIRMIGRIG